MKLQLQKEDFAKSRQTNAANDDETLKSHATSKIIKPVQTSWVGKNLAREKRRQKRAKKRKQVDCFFNALNVIV